MASFEERAHLVRNRFEQPSSYEHHNEDQVHVYSSHYPVPQNDTEDTLSGNSLLSRNGYSESDEFEMHNLPPDPGTGNLREHSKTGVTTSVNEHDPSSSETSQPGEAPTAWYNRHRHKRNEGTYSWTWELLALGVSAASIVAMIILLHWADNNPLLEWKFFLSLNAVISILGALCKAPFGFVIGSCLSQAKWNWFKKKSGTLETYGKIDSASHGPLGSISLAYHIHIKHWIVVGALVTVALTAFEPFLQAIVFFSGQTETPGTILAATQLDAGTYLLQNDAGSSLVTYPLPSGRSFNYEGPYLSKPDIGLVSALLNGLDTHYSVFQLTPPWTCPSGNCIWEPFTSAAICSTCYNISDHLQREGLFVNASRGTIPVDGVVTVLPNATLTKFSLPLVDIVNFDGVSGPGLWTAMMVAASSTNPGQTISFQHYDTLLAAYQVIAPARSFGDGQTSWNETKISATECGLYLCTQAYNSTVVNGTFTEQVLGSWSTRMPGSYAVLPGLVGPHDPDTLAEYESYNNHSLMSANPGRDFARADLVLEIFEQDLSDASVALNATRSFNITQNMTGSTAFFLGPQMMSNGNLIWPLTDTSGNAVSGIVTQALYESNDLGATFEQLAQSMTNWARHYSGAQYFSPRKDLLIQIRWEYLALPAICLVAGSIFIALLMFETWHSGLKPWKDDFIFSLAHSLDPRSEDLLRASEKSHGDTKKLAKKMTVKFEDTNGFWQLRAPTVPT